MGITDILDASRHQLDEALTRQLDLKPDRFEAHLTDAIAELPDEFTQPLSQILHLHKDLISGNATDSLQAGEFCFTCGIVCEKLQALALAQMEVENAFIGLDSIRTGPLAQTQSDQISRFIAARDRLFRKTADLTLKILLIGLGLLFLGLLLGIA